MVSTSDGKHVNRFWKIVDLVKIKIVDCVLKKEIRGPLENHQLSTLRRFSREVVLQKKQLLY